ncbi:MAG: hypothetical protein A2521_08980 [Deltaproteobacteria bacterium RIFOXYD12_FULL_57_12]|nr:MAG: hypothetical protein A2521_08980 [Deltaproteobacteria bacterium RIFOXYD12_FULL_57_12]
MPCNYFRRLLLLASVVCLFSLAAPLNVLADDDFATWLAAFQKEARQAGISEKTLATAFANLSPIPRVIELDRKQPEFLMTFWRYLDVTVSADRVEKGRRLLEENKDLLRMIERRYGVQPRFLVAFWGLETNYGGNLGSFPVIGALATLAHDPRRSDFFRQELLAALRILDEGSIPLEAMNGSWAGAMGQTQFMPSTFVRFAVDMDGDGRRDIWNSLPDVFASAANFLASSGWSTGGDWGCEVQLPATFNLDLADDQKITKTLDEWQALGIRPRGDSHPFPDPQRKAALILPAGVSGPAFLIFQNFRIILQWNRATLYAVAIGHLADRLTGMGPLLAPRPWSEEQLRRTQIEKIQQTLTDLGFDPGPADGIFGTKTRMAIKAFQKNRQMPADGYPSPELFKIMVETP